MFPGACVAHHDATSSPARTTAGSHEHTRRGLPRRSPGVTWPAATTAGTDEQPPPTTAGTDEHPRGGLPRCPPGLAWPTVTLRAASRGSAGMFPGPYLACRDHPGHSRAASPDTTCPAPARSRDPLCILVKVPRGLRQAGEQQSPPRTRPRRRPAAPRRDLAHFTPASAALRGSQASTGRLRGRWALV